MRRYTKEKRDSNHNEIKRELEQRGYVVFDIGEPVDCIVFRGTSASFLEIKVDAPSSRYTRQQLEFIANCQAPVIIARSVKEFLTQRLVGGLSASRKARLRMLLDQDKRKLFTPKDVKDILYV